MNGNVFRTITVRGTSEGLDKLTADINKLAAAEQNVAIVSEQSAKSSLSLEQSMARLERRYVEGVRAQQDYAKLQKELNRAVAQNPEMQERANTVLAAASQRYATTSTAMKGFASANDNLTKSVGLARHELVNLGRQAQDVGVSLASGQSPFMVLVQQGTQIADVFATSGGTLRGFFSQAAGWAGAFLKSTTGIVTTVLAIGGAAIYAASQFARASTTIEQALEEHNRLLKEGKALIDARTSAEARAQLQLKDQTQQEVKRNLLDLENKLNKAMEEGARIAERRSTRPAQVPGEMGEAPTAVSPLSDPGYARIAAASAALKASTISLKEFNAELGRVGEAHPELAIVVEDIKAAGTEIENAKFRAQALSDVLKGVATDAQYAALGLGSIAQFKLNTLQADQAREATERHAVAVMQLVANYGNLGPVVAQQVHSLEQQLELTKARTGAEALSIQFNQTIANAHLQQRTAVEATRIATLQRAIAEAQINKDLDQQLKSLQDQAQVLNATSEVEQARIRAAQEYDKAVKAGGDSLKAGAVAAQTIANARTVQDAREQAEADADAARSAERHAQANQAAAAAAARTAQHAAEAQRRWEAAAQSLKNLPFYLLDTMQAMDKLFESNQGGKSQFNPAGYTSRSAGGGGAGGSRASLGGTNVSRSGIDPSVFEAPPPPQDVMSLADATREAFAASYSNFTKELFAFTGSAMQSLSLLISGGGGATDLGKIAQGLAASGASQETIAKVIGLSQGGGITAEALYASQDSLDRLIALLSDEDKKTILTTEIAKLGAPKSIADAEVLQKLNASLQQLTNSTDNLANTMTDVLSPFYSSDPRRTHLGFRAFAGGGIMTPYGELPINHYAGGGIVNSPQVAVYGEGRTPEAYVPVPSGRIPVELKQPANNNQAPPQINIFQKFNVPVTREMSALVRKTAFQGAQDARRAMGG